MFIQFNPYSFNLISIFIQFNPYSFNLIPVVIQFNPYHLTQCSDQFNSISILVQFDFCIHSIQFLYSFNSVSTFIPFNFYIHSIQSVFTQSILPLIYSILGSGSRENLRGELGPIVKMAAEMKGYLIIHDTTVHVVYSALVNVKDVIIDVIIIIIIMMIVIIIIIIITIIIISKSNWTEWSTI